MPLSKDVELKTPEKKDWPLIPEDVYQVEITDLTAEESDYMGQKKEVFKFEFTIIEDGEHYGRKLWKRGSRVSPIPYKNGKNPLTWRVASAVAKHALTEEEGKAYIIDDMNALIGKQLRVTVSVTEPKPDGKQYNNVDSFLPAKGNAPAFDESRVKKDEPAAPHKPTPAEIVEKASGGKFKPSEPDEDDGGFDEAVFGETDSSDIPL
jgi:hypothetical protein